MKLSPYWLFLFLTATGLLTAAGTATAQTGGDSTFSLLVNGGLSFTHANDPHINKWLAKYHYPTEPRVPTSLHIEIAAMPVGSRLVYSLRLSTNTSGHNFTSYNLVGGLYAALIKQKNFLLLAGAGIGFHRDIITLNGEMPADYRQLAQLYNKQLSLHRGGLVLEPAVRAFWFPIAIRQWQLGLFAGMGLDLDINSHWKLGYYDNNHGKFASFKKLKKPADQQRASEHGIAFNTGLSLRFHIL